MNLEILRKTAQKMVSSTATAGKGILAIDESHSTCKKRFDALGVECNEENRRRYRQLLITTPGLVEYLGGMILFDETMRQKTDSGISFPQYLHSQGIACGIKVDTGAKDLALHPGEMITEGLDNLRERLAEYKELGAEFAKWRAVININENVLPSKNCLRSNAHSLARYAALCQEVDIVPMVEPEVIMDGQHSLERCYAVTEAMLQALYLALAEQRVALEGTILKTSMVISGTTSSFQADEVTVARETVRCLKANVPAEVAGVVFLSGGQTDQKATNHLNEMHKLGENLPWPLSYSYGRAIQQPALEIWAQNPSAVDQAQKIILHRSKCNSYAAKGKYESAMENQVG